MSSEDVYVPEGRVQRSWLYRFSQTILRPVFKLYFRHETTGIDNIPSDTGAVVATNHASNLDPPLIGMHLPRPLFTMAKESLHDIPLFGSLIRTFYSFPVRRGVFDRKALRRAKKIIETKNLLLMFPEGTRTRDGNLQKARAGIGKIVYEAECPVVPGYVSGSYDAMPAGSWFPRPKKTSTHFGKPISFDDIFSNDHERGNLKSVYQEISERILERIRKISDNA